ncbi:MAG: hypothetical protein U1C46_03785 [Bacteroidales bacterium]|nr:hypothetical protein [Bacteroidales bacterium]MDZ4203922.1 hypothetical protein [Bacteroidales bacterium]
MKKLVLLLVLVLSIYSVHAQKNNRTSAFNYLRNGKLDKAKEFIDKTIEHPQTINDAKAWFYRGNIYLAIHMSELPAFKALDENALAKSYESYIKAQEFDEKKEFFADIFTNMFVISEQFYNLGVESFNHKNYLKAMQAFESSAALTKEIGNLDTMALYNAGMTAELAEENTDAKRIYKELLGMNYQNPAIYSSMGGILLREHDTLSAMNYVKDGRAIFPDDFNLLIIETNIYLNTQQTECALKNLELAMQIDQNNPSIFFAVGTIYDQLKNSHPDDAANYLAKAEKAYMKSIELQSDYFDPIYNLGALYVNEAAQIIDKANTLPLSEIKKYDMMKTQADELLSKSLPYLETAHEMLPSDLSTMVSLKEIYTRLNMFDKMQIMNNKIKELQNR